MNYFTKGELNAIINNNGLGVYHKKLSLNDFLKQCNNTKPLIQVKKDFASNIKCSALNSNGNYIY